MNRTQYKKDLPGEKPNSIAVLETIDYLIILSLRKKQYFKGKKCFLSVLYRIFKCVDFGKERVEN